MAVDQIHHTEKTEMHRPAPAEHSKANFNSADLWKHYDQNVRGNKPEHHGVEAGSHAGDKHAVGADKKSPKEGVHHAKDGAAETKSKKPADHLIMTDPYAGLQGHGSTRAAGEEKARPVAGSDGQAVKPRSDKSAQPSGAENSVDPTDGQPIKIVGTPKNFNPDKPTVAVLDDFTEPKEIRAGITTLNHGEISAQAAEAKGMNVYRIQTGDAAGYGEQMAAVDAKIKSGELPLHKGDAVNVSLGQPNDLPIAGTTKRLGVPATNETLAQNKDKLLDRIRTLANDKNPKHAEAARVFGDVIKSNDAIKDIKSQGIDVVHAAGNEGTGMFSMHFLNATELNSTKPNGKPDSFSADHNLTVRGDGVLPMTTRPADRFSPTSIYQDKGSYEINLQNGQKIGGPITDPYRGWTGDRVSFDRNKYDRNTGPFNDYKNIPNEQPTSMLSDKPLGGKPSTFNDGGAPKPNFNAGILQPSGDVSGEAKIRDIRTTNVTNDLKFTDTPDNSTKISGILDGTSFSDTNYYDVEKMERIKRGGN